MLVKTSEKFEKCRRKQLKNATQQKKATMTKDLRRPNI
jgi:hypothetical protein